MFLRGEKDEIAYELDAFLAAARSCIDFISGMLALHIEGMNRRTGSTSLLKKLKPTSPFSRLLTRWQNWIGEVKEYRDECVHYRTIHMTGGFEIEPRDGEKVVTIIPVLVPEKVLPDKPSTRARMGVVLFDIQEIVGLRASLLNAEGPVSDSAKKLMEILAEFKRDKGYVRVENFCDRHVEKLHQLVSESFREVLRLKFQSYVRYPDLRGN